MSNDKQVERLARELMGWEILEAGTAGISLRGYRPGLRTFPGFIVDRGRVFIVPAKGDVRQPWNPFTDANADVQVLERVRETWKSMDTPERFACWSAFTNALCDTDGEWLLAWEYTPGTFARAALAALDATRGQEGGREVGDG
jgi:hypothetical protein